MNMKYPIVLFDADGTLFDFLLAEKTALMYCLNRFGVEATETMVKIYSDINDSYWKQLEKGEITKGELKYRRFKDFFAKIGSDVDPYAVADMYAEKLGDYHFLIDGAEGICESIKNIGCRIYVVTNGIKAVQDRRFCESGMIRYFDGVFVSEEVGAEKPDVAFFEAVSAAIPHFEAKKAIIIGDSLTSDIQGGKNFGIDTCLFAQTPPKYQSNSPKPDYCVSRLSDILQIVSGEYIHES